jgi:hypothetical protein
VAFPVKDLREFKEIFEGLRSERLKSIKLASEDFVKSQSGATDKIIKFLAKI